MFTWQNENGASNTVNIPVSGNNNGVTEDISTNQQLPPNDVQFVNVTYGGSGGKKQGTGENGGDCSCGQVILTYEPIVDGI